MIFMLLLFETRIINIFIYFIYSKKPLFYNIVNK